MQRNRLKKISGQIPTQQDINADLELYTNTYLFTEHPPFTVVFVNESGVQEEVPIVDIEKFQRDAFQILNHQGQKELTKTEFDTLIKKNSVYRILIGTIQTQEIYTRHHNENRMFDCLYVYQPAIGSHVYKDDRHVAPQPAQLVFIDDNGIKHPVDIDLTAIEAELSKLPKGKKSLELDFETGQRLIAERHEGRVEAQQKRAKEEEKKAAKEAKKPFSLLRTLGFPEPSVKYKEVAGTFGIRIGHLVARTFLPRDVYHPEKGPYGTYFDPYATHESQGKLPGRTIKSMPSVTGIIGEKPEKGPFSWSILWRGATGVPYLTEAEKPFGKAKWKKAQTYPLVPFKTLRSIVRIGTEIIPGLLYTATKFGVEVSAAYISQTSAKKNKTAGDYVGLTLASVGLIVSGLLTIATGPLYFAGKATTSPMRNAKECWGSFADWRKSENGHKRRAGYAFGFLFGALSAVTTVGMYILLSPFIAAGLGALGAAMGVSAAVSGAHAAVTGALAGIPYVGPALTAVSTFFTTTVGPTLGAALTFASTKIASLGVPAAIASVPAVAGSAVTTAFSTAFSSIPLIATVAVVTLGVGLVKGVQGLVELGSWIKGKVSAPKPGAGADMEKPLKDDEPSKEVPSLSNGELNRRISDFIALNDNMKQMYTSLVTGKDRIVPVPREPSYNFNGKSIPWSQLESKQKREVALRQIEEDVRYKVNPNTRYSGL